jgi:hypothetical protein
MKNSLCIALLALSLNASAGDSTSYKFRKLNAVYVELFGNAYGYSLNYDRIFYADNRLKMSFRSGIMAGFIPEYRGIGLPVEFSVLGPGKDGHHFETGIGFTYFHGKSKNRQIQDGTTSYKDELINVLTLNLRIGYRYQKPGSPWFVRAGFIPVFALLSPANVRNDDFFRFGKMFTPWGGFSIGYSFDKCRKIKSIKR